MPAPSPLPTRRPCPEGYPGTGGVPRHRRGTSAPGGYLGTGGVPWHRGGASAPEGYPGTGGVPRSRTGHGGEPPLRERARGAWERWTGERKRHVVKPRVYFIFFNFFFPAFSSLSRFLQGFPGGPAPLSRGTGGGSVPRVWLEDQGPFSKARKRFRKRGPFCWFAEYFAQSGGDGQRGRQVPVIDPGAQRLLSPPRVTHG